MARKCSIKFLFILLSTFAITFFLFHISGKKLNSFQNEVNFEYFSKFSNNSNKCEIIHIGIVWIGYQPNFYLYTMLKSLFFNRSNPLYFHIIVDDTSERILKNMFDKWAVPQVTSDFYNINDFSTYPSLTENNLKLMFPEIIPTSVTNRILILEPYLTFSKDVRELWTFFDHFKQNQGIGLVENQNNEYFERINSDTTIIGRGFNTDVILFNIQVLQTEGWEELLNSAISEINLLFKDSEPTDQNIINAVVSGNFELVYILPCLGNAQIFLKNYICPKQNQIMVVNWNSSNNVLNPTTKEDYFKKLNLKFHENIGTNLRTQLQDCEDFKEDIPENPVTWPSKELCKDFNEAYSFQWRTLLFFREFEHSSSKDDVTLVSHLTYDRLPVLEILSQRWEGPISLALYITDSELYKFMAFVENSKVLQKRLNIAYHAIFKERYHHPINLCRNVALHNVVTPYVFLNDIDFVPMQGMYESLKKYVSTIEGMARKALVVPAFDTNPKTRERIPATKEEMIKGMNKNQVFQTMKRNFPGGHSLTDHEKWKTATVPYKIEWRFKYEPYVVVQSNVTNYDERFVGYGWDKVAFFTKLKAQDYEFLVLPNSFIVHKRHKSAPEKGQFLKSKKYQNCLKNLMNHVVKELSEEYGIEIPMK